MAFTSYSLLTMKKKVRIIARLDVKAPHVVKGVHMEGLKKLGSPNEFAKHYYENGIDEILYIDIVASLYNRNSLLEIIAETTKNIFIPITVGGGIRSVEDAKQLLRAGADKIAVNSAAIKNPQLITALAEAFGAQCIVVSIHAKRVLPDYWEAYYDCGREHSGISVVEWAQQVEYYGAGEILLSSIDQDGTQAGCDCSLVKSVTSRVSIPVIAGSGIGCVEHAVDVAQHGLPDAIAIGSALHFKKFSIPEVRRKLQSAGINSRNVFC